MILVAGGSGQLGTAFRRLLPAGTVFLARPELDLSRPERIPGILGAYRPDALVNCAAYTAVDRAEDDEAAARVVNADAAGALAGFAAARGIPFVSYSTDYVFDGAGGRPYVESDPTAPINAYGRTKLAGEQAVLAAHPGAVVVRTSWLISGSHPNFVSAILRRVREGGARVVSDQRGRPTVAHDLAAATMGALERGATGILHRANEGETTWFDLAREAVRLAGLDPGAVVPCATEEFPTRAVRPRYSVLGSERAEALGLAPMPSWRDSLPAVVEEMLGWLS